VSVVDDRLSDADLAVLARMHVEALPESLVSRLGERYARSFYRYLARSSEELILLERRAGALHAACIVSLAPATLSRRLVYRTSLPVAALRAWRRLPWRGLLGGGGGGGAAEVTQPPGPEILLIFTVPGGRGQGVGARLLARCEALVAARGGGRLLVKTRDDAANRAVQFYERAAFRRVASVNKLGKQLAMFEKTLAGDRASR
jgi:GNAT superfamily N-acetyltransferase